jgi:hypothetical protein
MENADPSLPDYDVMDQALFPMGQLLVSISEIQGELKDDICSMSIESVKIEMPFELDVRVDSNGRLVVGGSPPTQQLETTFMPVFHKMKVNIQVLPMDE